LLQKNKELNLKSAKQKRAACMSFPNKFTEVAIAVMHEEDVSGTRNCNACDGKAIESPRDMACA
jgi:hypothetical protein